MFISSNDNHDESKTRAKDYKGNYPEERRGIPILSTDVILSKFDSYIREIRESSGLKFHEFDQYILPVITSVISRVNLLPASEYHHHSGPGGLICHLLDVTKRAVKRAQLSHFSSSTGNFHAGQRSVSFRVAAVILASVNHDIGKIATDMVVSNGQQGDWKRTWCPLGNLPLEEWATENNVDEVFVAWRKNRHNDHKQASVALSMMTIPAETWGWISHCLEGQDICIELWNAISGSGDDNQVQAIVSQADSSSVKFNLSYQHPSWSLEPIRRATFQLVQKFTMHLVSIGQWEVNQVGGVLWYIDHELYISWNRAVAELREHLDDIEYSVPKRPVALAKALIEEGFADSNGDEIYFDICPEVLGTPENPVRLKCLKVADASYVFPEVERICSIKQHQISSKIDVPKGNNPIFERQVGFSTSDSGIDISPEYKTGEVSKAPNESYIASKRNTQTITTYLVENGFQASPDGIITLSQADVETAVDLLVTSGITGITEVSAYSKLKSCKKVVFV
ncbi:MobH family relaxase [Vibrio diabolicus]|uniref:MobH family relaxase n=1 Tax=Vibrio diabolicus TaxID=50719 RepID=UPI004067EC36